MYRFIISVDANSGEMIDLIDNTGNIPFFFPLEETMVVGPMWYKPGEKNISISAEEHSVYQQLWENVSVAARGTTVYEFAMANSPRKGKLDGVLKYWPEVVVNRDYVWGVPTNDNIQQDDALFIAYAFIHSECNIDFEILSHYYPIFGYENTSPQKPIWWISFICYDNSRDDSFAIKIYANDGSIAMWSDLLTAEVSPAVHPRDQASEPYAVQRQSHHQRVGGRSWLVTAVLQPQRRAADLCGRAPFALYSSAYTG